MHQSIGLSGIATACCQVAKDKLSRMANFEIADKLRIPLTTIKRHQLDLYNSGYLKIAKKDKFKGYEYEIVSYEEYQKLQDGINNLLENSLKNLSEAIKPNSPSLAQLENGLPKAQKKSKVNGKAVQLSEKVS